MSSMSQSARDAGDWTGAVQAAAFETARRVHEAIEQACEAALQTGYCGVRVEYAGGTVTVGPDPAVPYGMIHEYRR
jgi:hypothetical protein